MRRLLIFGYGFTGAALATRLGSRWAISATSRNADTRADLAAKDLDPVDPTDTAALGAAVRSTDAILIAAPPGEQGCPGLSALAPHLTARSGPLISYLSTTGVYGDQAGGWVREDSHPAPMSPEGQRRVQAEQGWRRVAEIAGSPLFVFRLPGIYGPGRSALDRVRAGEVKRWVKPGQVFSRIHVDDLADLALALERPERAGVYAICDDQPAAPADVTAFAARLLDLQPSPEQPLDLAQLSPMAQRFWAESKRVPNARAKAALGWRPAYPSYREGLQAILHAETSA